MGMALTVSHGLSGFLMAGNGSQRNAQLPVSTGQLLELRRTLQSARLYSMISLMAGMVSSGMGKWNQHDRKDNPMMPENPNLPESILSIDRAIIDLLYPHGETTGNMPVYPEANTVADYMTRQLHIAVHGSTWARPESPRDVWLGLLSTVIADRKKIDER